MTPIKFNWYETAIFKYRGVILALSVIVTLFFAFLLIVSITVRAEEPNKPHITKRTGSDNKHSVRLIETPSPFKVKPSITYEIYAQEHISCKVLDHQGDALLYLYDGEKDAGKHCLEWDSTKLSSGIYYLSVETTSNKIVQAFALLK